MRCFSGIFIKSDSHQDDENLKIFVSAGVIGIVVLVSGLLVLIYRNGIRNLKRRNTQNVRMHSTAVVVFHLSEIVFIC